MPTTPASQLTLSLFDTTALSGLTLDAPRGGMRHREPVPEETDEAPPTPEPERVPARDWRLVGERALARGWKARAADNLAAIRLADVLAREGRHATAEEQEALSRFVGFGASELAQSLFRRPGEAFRPGWEDLGTELERLVAPEQLAGLARATQYAHYTPEFIVRAIWRAVTRMGFAGGTVLEPGAGTGLFLALTPEALAGKTSFTAVEQDPCTARIAALLHPDAWVRAEDFTKARIAETFELAVGNPPFSDRTVRADDPAGKLGLSLHDYFIARSIERLKPGGLAAFVTSRFTMDKADSTARGHIAAMADLVGAVRLPQGAMQAAAGTEVVVDVLVFQKRAPGVAPGGAEWDGLAEVLPEEDGEPAIHVNRHFAGHPAMVLGAHGRTSGPFGPTYTVRGETGAGLEEALHRALATLPAGIHAPSADAWAGKRPEAPRVRVGTAAEGATVKEGSYLVLDGRLVQVVDGVPVPVPVRSGKGGEGIPTKHARLLRMLIPVRDWTRAVLRAQEANEPWGPAQVRLRVAYAAFKREFGPINLTSVSVSTDPRTGEERETVRRPNLAPFADDPDCWLVSSIEHYDEDTGTAKPGPIFTERVIHPPVAPVVVTAADALAVVLHEVGHVDMARIAELLGRTKDEVAAELGEAVFLNPALAEGGPEVWETADAYLSGPVRTKLAAAAAAAALDPRFERNVAALRRVQPEDLRPSDITARLGGPWIPADAVEAFSAEVLGVRTRVRHTVEIASWSLDLSRFEGAASATSEWGTARRHAGLLLSDALNASVPQVWDVTYEDGREKRELNERETEAAKEKLARIKEAFERWVWTDPDRTDRLARLYNDRFNNLVPRAFDGSHLRLPGASSAIALRPHQKRAIWRTVAAGGTYIAHAVGAGKAQPLDAKVLTPTGWRRMGELRVGDAVIAGDGTPTRVMGVFPQGEKEIYRVSFSDGSATECCDEHLWLTRTYAERNATSAERKLGKDWPSAAPKVRSLAEIRRTLTAPHLGAKNHSIPMVGPVQFEPRQVPMDAYLLGVLLGDGTMTQGSVVITSADESLVNGLVLPENVALRPVKAGTRCPGWALRTIKLSGCGPTRSPNPAAAILATLGLMGKGSSEKFVPDSYKINSSDVRLAILQGLLDTDGTVSKSGRSVYFTTVSPCLADDVAFLVRSLGGIVRRSSKRPRYTHNGETRFGREAHTLCVSLPPELAPFRLARKAAVVTPKTKYQPTRYVVGVEAIGHKPAQCIAVEHPSRLYVTDDFIVTHNTMSMAAAIMEQKRLGLITKAMLVVPGHCLAQMSREFLALYPNARILVADETNFVKEKRARFLARAATANWDAIIITHSAFKFIAAPAAFERGMVAEEVRAHEELLLKVDGDDRLTRKRIEHAKEVLQAKLEALASRKDDMLTIAEIGVDQIITDEAQSFRKLSLATNMVGLKGVDPDGSQMAWDLYVKSRFVAQIRPQRPLILASGTPITNTLGEMFTLQRFMQPEVLEERGIHRFDAWASLFGDTRTELELQPSGRYKPVTRFAEFVNVPELIAMFRSVADVALKDDLREYLKLPEVRTGKRQIVTAPASPAFRAYQRVLDERIQAIEARGRPPQKGDDILLSVITDGRHAAIDLRFVQDDAENEPENKLNALIANVRRIWAETREQAYLQPDGTPHPTRGAAQMVFSDLGTEAAEGKRGFSAYRWIKQELVRMGVPASEIAFMQDYKKSSAKQRLFADVNAGKVRVLIGSTPTMGTGVNAQVRLAALHHLDVPWLPSDIEQREGRIERQGNQNREIDIYAYATLGSVDATSWQLLERKARFIAAALAGDRSIRRLEDVGAQANQFAMAKALASGDPRLMQKAGLEAEVARLKRLRAAHFDDQHAVRRTVADARAQAASSRARIGQIEADLARRTPTRGDSFVMDLGGKRVGERKVAGASLLSRIRLLAEGHERGKWTLARIGGFEVRAEGRVWAAAGGHRLDVWLDRTGHEQEVRIEDDLTPMGLVTRLEYLLDRFEVDLAEHRRRVAEAEARVSAYEQRLGEPFAHQAELDAKQAELDAIEESLAATGKDTVGRAGASSERPDLATAA